MAFAVITGASSGIGREIAIKLSELGYDIILAARRGERLIEVSRQLRSPAEIITIDLSKEENCYSLYERCRGKDVEILVNNAGFGVFGEFADTELSRELEMIDLNIRAVHILTKLFLADFKEKNRGKILNVASAAGFMPAGPMLSAYYATKAYVLSLTRGIAQELKKSGSGVSVSALCPGPVKTEFGSVAGVNLAMSIKGISAEAAASDAVRGMLSGKTVIIPGVHIRIGKALMRLVPDNVITALVYKFQKAKEDK